MTGNSLTFAVFRQHKVRTLFTVLSVTVAFAVFLVLATLYSGFAGLVNYGRPQRLDVWSDGFGRLPLSYVAKIAPISGVSAVSYQIGIFGHFRDAKNSVFVAGVPFEQYMKVFPELSVNGAERQAMLGDRLCAIAGGPLARKMNWKIGDTIPISGGPAQKNGGTTWYFHLCGIFRSTLPDSFMQDLVANYEYLNRSVADIAARDQVDQIVLMTKNTSQVSTVARTIEAKFANAQPTAIALPDALLYLSVVKSFRDIGIFVICVGLAVFLSMLLVTGNAMANSVRERLCEFAVMRAMGFSRRRLLSHVLQESAWIVGAGALLGLLFGWRLCLFMTPFIGDVLPYFVVNLQSVAAAILLAVLFSFLVGILPARRVTALPVADTLRKA
ncbi:MAG TPA: ABC transporter permease [Rhizomicrobium sp.]|nr:ABC transporter permease [Rhizomicrobium sp.]